MKNEYSVKEISTILKVSKPTIRAAIEELSIQPLRIDKTKRRFYSAADTAAIILEIKPNIDTADVPELENELESRANSRKMVENFSENSEKYRQTEEKSCQILENTENQNISDMIGILKEQLEKKDEQIKDLQDKLSIAYTQISELANKTAAITAADKAVQIMDKQEKKEKEDPVETDDIINSFKKEQKKGFWHKLFKKN